MQLSFKSYGGSFSALVDSARMHAAHRNEMEILFDRYSTILDFLETSVRHSECAAAAFSFPEALIRLNELEELIPKAVNEGGGERFHQLAERVNQIQGKLKSLGLA